MGAYDGVTVYFNLIGNRQIASISGSTAEQLRNAVAIVVDNHKNFRWTLTIEQDALIQSEEVGVVSSIRRKND
jgi:hypothetical protein